MPPEGPIPPFILPSMNRYLSAFAASVAAVSFAVPSVFAQGLSRPQDVYIPMDHWVYNSLDRLHALGYADTLFAGIKPYTWSSVCSALEIAQDKEGALSSPAAEEIIAVLNREGSCAQTDNGALTVHHDAVYARIRGIKGLALRDSFHLGQTLVNDYGRPYQEGVNANLGYAASAQYGRFSLTYRGEYQHAPSASGYNAALTTTLQNIDHVFDTNQATIPSGPIPSVNALRVIQANASVRLLNHQISFGKSDHWLSPAHGGSFAYSTNADNVYAFQIDRTRPLYVPLLSRLTGPFRYEFMVGSIQGHTYPNSPWIHLEKINFQPTKNVEFGFSRMVLWGGKGHTPITLHTFLKSFFSFQNVPDSVKDSREDPGARFSTFDFNWRLPGLRHWATFYTDAMGRDDVNPIAAPRQAAIRTGLYLSHLPHAPQWDFRAEGGLTDPRFSRSVGGGYNYVERIQRQGYTNKGMIMGDFMGRESKGGQAWLTYHMSPKEQVQLSYRNAKAAKDFIPGGTTQNLVSLSMVKRFRREFEVQGDVQFEHWAAPVYSATKRNNGVFTFGITWYPEKQPKF